MVKLFVPYLLGFGYSINRILTLSNDFCGKLEGGFEWFSPLFRFIKNLQLEFIMKTIYNQYN